MSRKKTGYNRINVFVILVTLCLFFYKYREIKHIMAGVTIPSFLICLSEVMIVHTIKAGRLYFALYGAKFNRMDFIKTYCKVTPVSLMIPFKLGEFFRMFCYGSLIGNILKGIVIILLDRFMDTMALVTVIILVWIFHGGKLSGFVYMLFLFLLCVLITYFVYPGIHSFWKKYLLGANASRNKLKLLRLLESLNMIYHETENVVKGRSMILYFVSLIAWGIEIGSFYLLNGIGQKKTISADMFGYLTSAMIGGQSLELERIIFASMIFLITIYLVMKAGEILIRKEEVA